MPFIHHDLSVVELIAVGVTGLVVLAVVVGVLVNIPALARYLRISKM
jgi:hypothetical protein